MEAVGAAGIAPAPAQRSREGHRGGRSVGSGSIPPSSKKLVGSKHTYRIRIGDYRVVYDVLTNEVVIEVIRVAHRRDVYR
jgi:mRNA-degrading endonuclease RelE of RelBE toxin-antitoxin system